MLFGWCSWLRDGWTRVWRQQSIPQLRAVLQSVLMPVVVVYLLADFNPSFAEQTSGGLPFFRDDGELTLPPQSNAELEQSMPEVQAFLPNQPSLPASSLMDPPPLG